MDKGLALQAGGSEFESPVSTEHLVVAVTPKLGRGRQAGLRGLLTSQSS